jgi:hypothetical protein
MSKPWTPHDVSELIAAETEHDTADRVLLALKAEHGKRITTRLADKMPGGSSKWKLRRQYGMTHLENRHYYSVERSGEPKTAWQDKISLLLGHFIIAKPLDATAIETLNPAYFSGRRRRNKIRMETRNDLVVLSSAAATINTVLRARASLKVAEAALATLTSYDAPLGPDSNALDRAMRNGGDHASDTAPEPDQE